MWKARTPVLALGLVLLPAAVGAQGVRWESTGTVEFGGALGLIARLAGAGEVQSTYALQDGRWLIDSEASGTIYDYAEGRFTLLDHQSRTWFTTSFAEMARALEARAAEARQELDRARAEAGDDAPMAPPAPDEDDVDVDVGVKVSVDRTGERQQIAGYDAERLIVTVEVGSAEVAEGGSLGGTMVLVSDVWTSADFPANRVWRTMFQEHPEWADVEDLRDAGAGLQAAFALDGRIRLAMEESATSVEDVGGHALLNRTSLVLVAPGAELDRAAVLAAYDQGLGPDVKGAAANVAREAAGDAVRGALGRFGLGKKEEPVEEVEPTQAIVMRLTDRVTSVEQGGLPPATFLPPSGYQERAPEWLAGGPSR